MLTFGFYDSKNHDRRYNAIQMSSIFDGIIEDGIFMSIGDRFATRVKEGMQVSVGTGRAWFNHTWTLNDAPLYLMVEPAEITINRIDAVVLEVNSHQEVRANSIRIIKGTVEKPVMEHSEYIHQYPLAYITVPANAIGLSDGNIENVVGMDETPFVTAPVQPPLSIEDIVKRFEAQWEEWLWGYSNQCTNEYATWKDAFDAQFKEWFEGLNTLLDGDVAANLANAIEKLKEEFSDYKQFREDLLHDHAIYDPLMDDNGNPIIDSEGENILGRLIFVTK